MTAPTAPNQARISRTAMPGGVSGAARINGALGGPFVAVSAAGGHVTADDGRTYLDLNMGFGASMLGHSPAPVMAALERAMAAGIRCGLEIPEQAEVATRLTELIPSAELVRFTLSGTETDWHAIRTARVFTGRRKIVKFEGHFHGFSDHLGYSASSPLDQAGPPDRPNLVAMSGGMPESLQDDLIVLPWNDTAAMAGLLETDGDIAAVIMEPINFNSGALMPHPGYLEAARELTTRHGVVLIFDEILSGFRTGTDCAQGHFGVTPDLTALGKAIGAGLPVGALVGRRDVMEAIAPVGKSVHSGTYQGHPLGVAAIGAVLDVLTGPGFYPALEARTAWFTAGLREAFAGAGVPVVVNAIGDRFVLLFGLTEAPVTYRDVARADAALSRRFIAAAFDEGLYFHTGTNHGFSPAHTDEELRAALAGIGRAASIAAGA